MGSISQPKLPVIDFSEENLRPGTDSRFSTRQNVRIALEKYGAFEATYSKLTLDLHNAILAEMEGLFALPHDVKVKNTSDKPLHSYVMSGRSSIRFEGLALENATSLESVRSFAKLMWPDRDNQRFCDAAALYSKTVSELEQLVKKTVFESYGVENHYEAHADATDYLLRFIKYRPQDDTGTDIGVATHTDKGMLTILHHNQVNGLEIQTKDGEWIMCDSSPKSFIVMAGDGLMAWSNGRIFAPPHKVVTKGGVKEIRYTLAMFTFHNGIVQIPAELVDDEHPLQYKDFENYGMVRYFNNLPTKDSTMSVAKLYCGI